MDQLICASLSHTHYWYEVGMLKVPAKVNSSLIQFEGCAALSTSEQIFLQAAIILVIVITIVIIVTVIIIIIIL